MLKRLLSMFLVFLFLVSGTALGESQPDLTLMVYLCGSNLETEAGAASSDLAEMMEHYPTDGSLRVIVMPSGSLSWQSDISTEETAIYELTNNGLTKLCTLPLQSMGAPAALTALLDYGYTHAPARRHALIMWDHGAGPNVGLCFDELFPTEQSMDGLTLQELSSALSNSPAASDKLAWIGFDACLMASLETACTVAPYADYMIASQETEPVSGWNYAFLSHAAEDASGAETGKTVIDGYFQSLSESLAPLTLSCISLSEMPAVNEAMNQLFNTLHLSLDERSYPTFAECRVLSKSPGYSTGYEYDLVDLVDLLQLYQDEGLADCSDLLNQLENSIVTSRSNMPFINGLSIYFPHYGTQENVSFPAFEGYAAFIADMSAIRLGKPLTDWSRTHRPEAALDNGVTHVTMALTPEQAATLDTATLFILKQTSSSDYQFVYRTNDVALTEDNLLSATYEEQALFIVDGQGEIISTALPYSLQGDAVVLTCMLTRFPENMPEDDEWYTFVRCLFRQDEQGQYRLTEVQESTDDPMLQGKGTVRLEDYDVIGIFQGTSIPAYAQDGQLLPPGQWAKGEYIYGWEFNLADHPDWGIAFASQQDDRSRYALLQITDTQNHVVCSDLLSIPNPNITDFPAAEQTLADNEACCIRFVGAQAIQGIVPALRLNFACENRGSESLRVALSMLQLDDCVLSNFSYTSPEILSGETKNLEVEIPREELEAFGIQSVEQLQMGLSLKHGYIDVFMELAATCSFAADLTGIAPSPAQPDIASSTVQNGLALSLYDLVCSDDRHLTGTLSIRNISDTTLTLDATGYFVNDLQLQGYLTDSLYSMKLSPGAVCHTGFNINLEGYDFNHYRPENTHFLLESLGMTQIDTLDMTLYDVDQKQRLRVSFTLAEPFDLPVDETNKRVDAWPVLYSKDGVTIRLADFTWNPASEYLSEYRYVNLLIENNTESDVTLRVPQTSVEDPSPTFRVNGHSPLFVSAPTSAANTITMQSLWYPIGEGYETMEQIEMDLLVTDANGRSDPTHAAITALTEARTEDDYRILEADKLQVSVSLAN